MAKDLGITIKKAEDTAQWYEQVCIKSEVAEFGEIKGTVVIRPRGFYMWEQVQSYFAQNILPQFNVENASFPMFIPERFFKKEAEHAQGFAPELAWAATNADTGEEEKAIIRPTSETIIVDSFRRWLRTHKDLPIKVNQWCNVVRWEVKQTKLFLRGREFLWQEGHCIYATREECKKDVLDLLDAYATMARDLLAMPSLQGPKTPAERFPGAEQTYTFESFMPDGKALQMGTTHELGQGFMKAFDVQYVGEDEKQHYPFYNSWGLSTRLLGAVIMMHSDDKGLVLPPRLAKQKVVIVPAVKKDNAEQVMQYAHKLKDAIGGFSVSVDDRDQYSMGWKMKDAELKGVPFVLIVGQQEMEKGTATFKARDLDDKQEVHSDDISAQWLQEQSESMHQRLYDAAKHSMEEKIVEVDSLDALKEKIAQGKIVIAPFWTDKENEKQLVEQLEGVSTRCIATQGGEFTCVFSGKPTDTKVYFSRSY